MELFILWIAFSIMAAYIASNKGRSGFGWFMLSLCLSPLIGFIGALIAKPKNVSTENSFSNMAPPNPQPHRNRWEPSSHKNKEKDEYDYDADWDDDEYEDDEYEKSSNLADVSAEKIKALNKLKEDGLITEDEYKDKRKKLLENMF